MKNILIIEDNHTQQEIYKYWFVDDSAEGVTQCIEPGHRTALDFCDSIPDAEKFLETKDYDFILLDLHLGDKESGLSFLERLPKRKDVKPKVIVVSAYLDFLAEGLVSPITPRQELVMKEKKDIVWLTKEEATQKRLME
ncbi:MAG: response regulator, partial [Methanomicrobia archaeon]|nr:response regulator [Methanomicrobia archaeon]